MVYRMKQVLRRFAIVCAAITLSACGDGDSLGGGEEDGGNPSYKVLSFNVAGTSVDNSDGSAPISPTVNSGRFTMRWQVQDLAGEHLVSAAVSSDNSLSGGDLSFYTEACDSEADCGSSNPYTKNCTFNNSNEIFCDGQVSDAADLTTFLADGVPKSAFIIFQACASGGSPCRSASHAVEFQ